jgi:uncharacterized protein (UPF0332 family)
MRDFQYYLKTRKIKKVQIDVQLSKSLRNDLIERAKKANKLDIEEYSKFIFENIYDSLREMCDAILALKGYKSYSHEGSISYLKNLDVSPQIILRLDRFRDKRNSSKYYGKSISREDAKEIKEFYEKYFNNLLTLLDKEIKIKG